jgi:outer membrane autotransporter protein
MGRRLFFARKLSILTTGIVFCAAILLYVPWLYAQGAAFSVSIPGLESNYIAAGAGISMQWKEFAVLFLNYDIQFGQKDFWAQGINAGVRIPF